jgi:hypothetical protein
MSAAGRIAAFGAALTVAFAGAYAAGAAFVPDGTAASWQARSEHSDAHGPHTDGTHTDGTPAGLSLSRDGYLLAPVQAPGTPGVDGRLSFTVLGPSGAPLRDYASTHDRDMHLMVVRTDGSGFRHVHPQLDRDTGVWSLPWRWERAGTYRVFTDFQPEDTKDAPALTLSRTVEVAGAMSPTEPGPVRNASEVDGYTVTLTGDLTAGATAPLTAEFSRGGEPVTELSPYLGAFGHLAIWPSCTCTPPAPSRPPVVVAGPRFPLPRRPRRPAGTCCTWTSRSTAGCTPRHSSSTPPPRQGM